jgi:flavin-dependent dehydrogenase
MSNNTDVDVVIIGAGPAGSIAAMKLLNAGLSVVVLEKATFPRYVIGESLLPHCMDYLNDLDLIDLINKEGFQVKTGATFVREGHHCQFIFKNKHTKGWDTTWQVQRERFDQVLINEAENRGADVKYRATVCGFKNADGFRKITYNNEDGVEVHIQSKFVVDASGYGRVLPKLLNLIGKTNSVPRSGAFCRIKDTKRPKHLNNNISHISFDDNKSWAWVIPFSNGTSSIGLIGDTKSVEKWMENNGQLFHEIFSSDRFFGERFKNEELIMSIRSSTNYASTVTQLYGPGYVLCGNATEFLDPIFSSGVTLAIASGHNAATLVIDQLNGKDVDWEKDYSEHLIKGINVFRSYVKAWYDGTMATIFFTDQFNEKTKGQLCSVLAGYVWDESNPFVSKHYRLPKTLAQVIELQSTAEK